MAKFVTKSFDFKDVLLVPKKCIVNSRKDISLSTIISHNEHSNILLGVPLISANMDTITGRDMAAAMSTWSGAGFLHRYQSYTDVMETILFMKAHNFHPIIPSIGVSSDEYWSDMAFMYLSNGADGICIDIAHGHSENMIKQVKELTTKYPKEHFIAGNIATKDAAKELIDAGATGLKVGIGPGRVCTTRLETGAGIPQLTAIMEVAKIAHQRNIPVIADGGIKSAGDIVKALAAGASAVMCGSLFAGCDETPMTDGTYRGMASFDAKKDFNLSTDHVEGRTIKVKDKGPVKDIIIHLTDGIRSGISYCGARNINELWSNAEFTITK